MPSVPQSITFSPQYARWVQPPLVCHWSISSSRRIGGVEIDISEQRVAGADLELAPGVVEEPLIEPLGRVAQRQAAAENGVIGLADEVPGAVALRAGARGQGVVDPDEVGPLRRPRSRRRRPWCHRRTSPWPPRPRSSFAGRRSRHRAARSAAACCGVGTCTIGAHLAELPSIAGPSMLLKNAKSW